MTSYLAALTVGSKRVFRWWCGQIQSCAHDVMAKVAPSWSRSVTVFLEKGRIRITDTASSSVETLADIPFESTQDPMPDPLIAQTVTALKDGSRVHFVVSSHKAFIRQLRLPVAALPHLASAVSLQLPKLLPMRPDELLTATELVSADTRFGLIDIAVLKRAEIEPMVNALTVARLHVSSIRLADGFRTIPRFRFQLSSIVGQESALRRMDKVLVRAAAGLALACIAVMAIQSYRAEHSLSLAEVRIRPTATAALNRRQALLNKLEPIAELSEFEARPALAPLLAELTSILPQDTWITTFEIKDRRLRIVGVTPDSAALVKQLSGASALDDIELRSSMSAGIGTGKDRYEILAEIKGGGP